MKHNKEFNHVALNMDNSEPRVAFSSIRTGSLAIHKTVLGNQDIKKKWTLTHVRSGKSILQGIKTLREAKEILRFLEGVAPWEKSENELRVHESYTKIRYLVRNIKKFGLKNTIENV